MTCADVASTGVPVAAIVSLGITVLLAGVVLVVLARSRRARTSTAVVVLLLLGGALALCSPGTSPAHASPPGCAGAQGADAANNHVTIVQTSVITGMAPAVAPAPIIGRVTNHGGRSTRITSVTVSIAGVTGRAGQAAGLCIVTDYVLNAPTMPVGRTLGPGRSAVFRGASIGFRNKSTNQDACEGAVVHLHYVSR